MSGKRIRGLSAAALAVALAAAAPARCTIVERIVAKVNGDIITLTEWQDAVESARTAGQGSPDENESKEFSKQVLDRMATDKLIIQAGKAEGLKATDSEVAPHVDRELDAVRSRFGSAKEFNAQLKKEGISLGDLRVRYQEQIKERFIYLKMVGRKQRELETTCEVTEAEISDYYKTNKGKGDWKTPPRIRARHIQFGVPADSSGEARKQALAGAREKVAAAQAALKRGETFAEVAKSLSEDATTRAEGGDLGVFAAGTYHESLENAAFALKPGQVSKPVESPVGLHLIQLVEKLPSRPMTLEDSITVPAAPGAPGPQTMTLREFIQAQVKNEKLSERFQKWVQELRDRALIQYFLEEPERNNAES